MIFNYDHDPLFVNGYPTPCPGMNDVGGLFSFGWRAVYNDDTVYCRIISGAETYCVMHGRPARTCQAIFSGTMEHKRELVGWECPDCHAVFPTMAMCNEIADGQ